MGGWLDGPPAGAAGDSGTSRGARLGLPPTGSGSLAPLGRRLVALLVDWAACSAISAAFFQSDAMAVVGVLAIENVVLVGTLGTTLGHRLLGLRVVRVVRADPERTGPVEPAAQPGLLAGAVRAVLLCLVIPAVVWDADGRGMHDRLAGTVIVRR
ncbi:RDD family protein [Cellulomonas sp. WB94]|nr:RDD family protein [Cellulomonas sp. WB94]